MKFYIINLNILYKNVYGCLAFGKINEKIVYLMNYYSEVLLSRK